MSSTGLQQSHSISSCPHDFGHVGVTQKRNYENFLAEISYNERGLMFPSFDGNQCIEFLT